MKRLNMQQELVYEISRYVTRNRPNSSSVKINVQAGYAPGLFIANVIYSQF